MSEARRDDIMPHAVILHAKKLPNFESPLSQHGGSVQKVVEVTEGASGWLLKSLIIEPGSQTRFLTRIDRRDNDDWVVHLDDHMPVERSPQVFDHLALITKRVIDTNQGSSLGTTNLQDRIPA